MLLLTGVALVCGKVLCAAHGHAVLLVWPSDMPNMRECHVPWYVAQGMWGRYIAAAASAIFSSLQGHFIQNIAADVGQLNRRPGAPDQEPDAWQ